MAEERSATGKGHLTFGDQARMTPAKKNCERTAQAYGDRTSFAVAGYWLASNGDALPSGCVAALSREWQAAAAAKRLP